MNRQALTLVGAVVLAAGLCACSAEGEECGNGEVESGEQCDDGNEDETDYCRSCAVWLPPRTTLKWVLNGDPVEGFTQDGCSDLGVDRVRIELTGASVASLEDECPTRQVVFEGLAPGVYEAAATPLDAAGNPLVTAPTLMQVTAGTGDIEDTIVIPPDTWIGPYTGTFFFTVRWGSLGCVGAGVAQQRITLRVGGQLVGQTTTGGQALDGSAAGPCVDPDDPSPQAALGVPFGFATIEIAGLDSTGVETFAGQFDTFVGAGPSNPTLAYDVATAYDAGVDAP